MSDTTTTLTPDALLAMTPEARAVLPLHNYLPASGSKDCVNCTGCTRCVGCSYCSYCVGCSGCSGCSCCVNCSGCSDCSCCSDCSDCRDCIGIRNGHRQRYVAYGVQLTADQWAQLQAQNRS